MPDEVRKAEVIETTIGKLAEAAAELARRGLKLRRPGDDHD